MPNGEYPHLVVEHGEAVQGDVAGGPIGDHQFTQLTFDATPQQWMLTERLNGGADRARCGDRGLRILGEKMLKDALDMLDGARGIDYFRHGFGRGD